jgi:hypothetical protein
VQNLWKIYKVAYEFCFFVISTSGLLLKYRAKSGSLNCSPVLNGDEFNQAPDWMKDWMLQV